MIVSALIGLALGGTQELREAEWRRDVEALVPFATAAVASVRAEAARALGRSRAASALEPLTALARDADPEVREQALVALAWVPGGEVPLREALDLLPRHAGWGAPERSADLRGRALWALGHHTDAADVDRLVAALAEGGPAGTGAAYGLGRMGRDGLEDASEALGPLLTAADRDLGELTVAAAYATGRIGCDATHAPQAAARARTHPRPTARAYLLRCAGQGLEDEARREAIAAGLTDDAPFVRISALNLATEGDPTAPVAEALGDADPGVRSAAIAALGRLGVTQPLARLAEDEDPWRAAEAVDALLTAGGTADPAWSEGPVPVRAVLAAHADPEAAIDLALEADEAAVRSAAASVWLGHDAEPEAVLVAVDRLLMATDPVVRGVGVSLLAEQEPKEAASRLLVVARVETDAEVLAEALSVLGKHASEWEEVPETLDVIVRRAAGMGHARLGHLARELAAATGLEPPTVAEDEVLDVDLDLAARILGATVHTSRGRFRIDFHNEVAPVAVVHFAKNALAGFYDEALFHRVVPGFVAQTGCPRGDGWGGPGYTLPDEVSGIRYAPGMVGMARADRDTGGSQWFVTTTDQPHLTGDYTLFAEITEGLGVVRSLRRGDRIERIEIDLGPEREQ